MDNYSSEAVKLAVAARKNLNFLRMEECMNWDLKRLLIATAKNHNTPSYASYFLALCRKVNQKPYEFESVFFEVLQSFPVFSEMFVHLGSLQKDLREVDKATAVYSPLRSAVYAKTTFRKGEDTPTGSTAAGGSGTFRKGEETPTGSTAAGGSGTFRKGEETPTGSTAAGCSGTFRKGEDTPTSSTAAAGSGSTGDVVVVGESSSETGGSRVKIVLGDTGGTVVATGSNLINMQEKKCQDEVELTKGQLAALEWADAIERAAKIDRRQLHLKDGSSVSIIIK
jgi:hypothetical protein